MHRACLLALGLVLTACGNGTPLSGAPEAGAGCAPVAGPDDPDSRPLTIPALRQWTPGAGAFLLHPDPHIVAPPELREVAEVLAADLEALIGRPVGVGDAGPREGDIHLRLGECDARVGIEGYRMTVGTSVEIRAVEPHGAFNGTRTLLQLLRQGERVAAGVALDWPRYPERGMMVDAGRKYFTPEWFHQHIRELAWLKLNYLHLHFSDNEGFRIESLSHPEIVSAEHLTQDEVRAIVALAQRYFITVVPEIDMPGHMEAALAPHPGLRLRNALGVADAGTLDVTNPEALRFAQDLIEEFLPLFPGPYWHTGADEVIPFVAYPLYPALETHARAQYGAQANGKDAIHGFVNWVDELVRSHGRTARMWHDDMNGGSAVARDPRIVAEWWTNVSPLSDLRPPDPQELLARGHRIMNAGWFPTYYVVGGAFGSGLPPPNDMRTAYETWEAHEFYGPLVLNDVLQYPPEVVAADEPRHLGTKLNVWCDGPEAETEAEVARSIAPRLRVIAQKSWSSAPLSADYAGFEGIAEAVGHAPGY